MLNARRARPAGDRSMKKYQLMAPGPTPVPSQALLAMAQPMIHHRTPAIKAVLTQHSESSTGVLHDVRGFAAVTRNTDAILIVDAVSSLAIADLQMDAWGVDAVVAGSQKGLMLPPGLGFCALSGRAWARTRTSTLPKYYFDLAQERKFVV